MTKQAGRDGLVKTDLHSGIAYVTMARPPENRLEPDMLQALLVACKAYLADPSVRVLVILGAGENFSLGTGPDLTPAAGLQALVACLEAAPIPVVAALSGYVRGPAMALAMAAHYRIATLDAVLTLPETAVGLLPACGTVQRMCRMAGMTTVLDMCLYGQRLDAETAAQAGLIDAIIEGDLIAGIGAFGREVLARRMGPRPAGLRQMSPDAMPAALQALAQAKERLGQTMLLAPRRILDTIEAAYLLPYEAGLRFEAQAAEDAQRDPAGRGLRYLAAAERHLPLTLLASNPDGRNGLSAEGMEIAGSFRAAWILAARALVQTGVSEAVIDAAALAYGYRVGPFETAAQAQPKAGLAERLGDALLAEAARMMEAGRLSSAAECDALAALATGFPRWRGGPLHAAEVAGLMQRLRAMEGWDALDPVWQTPDLLRAAAARGHWPRKQS